MEGKGAVRHLPGDLSSILALVIVLTNPHPYLHLNFLLWKIGVFKLHDF